MKNRRMKVLVGIPIFLAVCAAGAAVVMLLWNWIVPAVIGWGTLTFWQAAGLLLLCRLLLGGFGHHMPGHFHGAHRHMHDAWKERAGMRDKVRHMAPDERREYIRRHMFGCGPGQSEHPEHDGR